MMLIFGLMLLQTAACLELNCSFNQKDSCYAALGHKLSLLMVNTSENDLTIKKRIHNSPAAPVCRVQNDKIRKNLCDLFNNRTEVTVSNGTLIINGVIREDSGNYNLNVERSNGTITSADLQVNVEAPIGSVEVSISCSSNGVKSVSCSSDGDQLIYSWTLNGESLMDGNATIQLNEETNGNIICSVKNHVSDGQKSISVKRCPGSTTAAVTSTQTPQTSENVLSVLLIVLACVSLTLILLFFTACHIYKRKQLQSTPVPAGGTELVYAQISHDKHPKSENKSESQPAADAEYAAVRLQTSKKEKKKEEVQYGEVTFTQNHSNALHDPKEDCVYSQVQRH